MVNGQFKRILTTFLAVYVYSQSIFAATVIEDQGVTMSRAELERVIERLPDGMRRAAAVDTGDRFEVLNQAMVNKKLAMEADKLSPENDPEAYWKLYFMIQRAKQKFVFERFMEELQVPDMSSLARERYDTERDKYASVEEKRMGSHILFACPPGCPRDQVRLTAEDVFRQLNQGQKFEDMVAQYSQDEGTKAKGGRMTRWMTKGEPKLSPRYLEGLFSIEKVGGYSPPVETEFGFHIIRLDEIQGGYYRSYDEVRDQIIGSLEAEYRELAAKEFRARFLLTEDVRIDGPAMEEIFAPYNPEDAQ